MTPPFRANLEWWKAGYAGDPIPGDSPAVDRFVVTCNTTAGTCGGVASNLRRLKSHDNNISEAVAKILQKAEDTARGMDAAKQRYEAMARAMTNYSPVLLGAQAKSAQGLHEAIAARKNIEAATAARNEARQKLTNPDQAARDQAQTEVAAQDGKVKAANAAYQAGRSKIEAAIRERDAGASQAASQINMDLEDNSLNDSFWDKVVNFFTSIGEWVWENIDTICLVLDLLALILAVTGVGGPVAAALLMVSKVARAISTIKTVVEVYQAASRGDWAKVGMTVGLFVLGKGISKYGGKLLEKSVGKYANRAAVTMAFTQPSPTARLIKAFNTSAGRSVNKLISPTAATTINKFVGSHLALTPLPKQAADTVTGLLPDFVNHLLGRQGEKIAESYKPSTATERVLERAL